MGSSYNPSARELPKKHFVLFDFGRFGQWSVEAYEIKAPSVHEDRHFFGGCCSHLIAGVAAISLARTARAEIRLKYKRPILFDSFPRVHFSYPFLFVMMRLLLRANRLHA